MTHDPFETLDLELEEEITEVTVREEPSCSPFPSPFWNGITLLLLFGMMYGSWKFVENRQSARLPIESSEKQIVLEDHSDDNPLAESEVVEVESSSPTESPEVKKSPAKASQAKKIVRQKIPAAAISPEEPYTAGGDLDLDNPETRKKYLEANVLPVQKPAAPTNSEETERESFIPFESE